MGEQLASLEVSSWSSPSSKLSNGLVSTHTTFHCIHSGYSLKLFSKWHLLMQRCSFTYEIKPRYFCQSVAISMLVICYFHVNQKIYTELHIIRLTRSITLYSTAQIKFFAADCWLPLYSLTSHGHCITDVLTCSRFCLIDFNLMWVWFFVDNVLCFSLRCTISLDPVPPLWFLLSVGESFLFQGIAWIISISKFWLFPS